MTQRPQAASSRKNLVPDQDGELTEHDEPARNRPKTRACLACKSQFLSSWSGERLCRRCKQKQVWRESAPAGANRSRYVYGNSRPAPKG